MKSLQNEVPACKCDPMGEGIRPQDHNTWCGRYVDYRFHVQREHVLAALQGGPKDTRELNVGADFLRSMERDGLLKIDPDMFPDEYVPGNPMVARLEGDETNWPGWSEWNL